MSSTQEAGVRIKKKRTECEEKDARTTAAVRVCVVLPCLCFAEKERVQNNRKMLPPGGNSGGKRYSGGSFSFFWR